MNISPENFGKINISNFVEDSNEDDRSWFRSKAIIPELVKVSLTPQEEE